MEIFEGRYYKNCTWFLKSVGLWPNQSKLRKKCSLVLFFLINATVIIPESIIYVEKCGSDINVTFENSAALMLGIGMFSKFIMTAKSSDRLRLLFEQIAKDWQRIIDKSERKILTKYSEEGRSLVTFYTVYVFFTYIVYMMMPFSPLVLDILFPLNESRPKMAPFYADYIFFETADYHYWVLAHIIIAYLPSCFLVCGVDTTFVLSVKHTCALFSIICHRLDSKLKFEENDITQELVEKKSIIRTLRRIVILHNESIRCAELLENSFNWSFLVLNFLCVIGLALGGVYLFYIYHDIYKLIQAVSFMIGLAMHLLYMNWVGQMLIDESGNIFQAVYFSNWYLVSPKFRIFDKIIMDRSKFPYQLTAGKLTVLSMENFGALVKTIVSYCTIIASLTTQ